MCNLYRMDASRDEVARAFRAGAPAEGNYAAEVYPGYTGLVIAEGDLRAMTWGFPLAQVSKKTGKQLKPKPVNNTRTDKLNTWFWRDSFEHRRCLIPVTRFAEAEGERGRMTRTWLSLPDRPVFACAGLWAQSDEWGAVYSMVMTDPAPSTSAVHDRLPVILRAEDHARWTDGTPDEAKALCVPYAGEIAIERTGDPWFVRR